MSDICSVPIRLFDRDEFFWGARFRRSVQACYSLNMQPEMMQTLHWDNGIPGAGGTRSYKLSNLCRVWTKFPVFTTWWHWFIIKLGLLYMYSLNEEHRWCVMRFVNYKPHHIFCRLTFGEALKWSPCFADLSVHGSIWDSVTKFVFLRIN